MITCRYNTGFVWVVSSLAASLLWVVVSIVIETAQPYSISSVWKCQPAASLVNDPEWLCTEVGADDDDDDDPVSKKFAFGLSESSVERYGMITQEVGYQTDVDNPDTFNFSEGTMFMVRGHGNWLGTSYSLNIFASPKLAAKLENHGSTD